ncbi:catechol 2,3-dioxygenase [Lentibacillus persicus]|uniref:Metapyrocatechase n=1 Tax=Lentibacillus persicus TaxID=640948 RepID=A0A1I1YXF7_9BACI|nr:catechol 2,3-dioxygenase [Lentibacillus persicus]SFE23982.1 catechol 2,3-dioxygenase [Lentibacillus persicus]
MEKEPIFDIAHLAHIEIYSPKLEETVTFFKDILGMDEAERQGKSVYMRAYEDHYHNTLVITENHEAGLGHFSLRTTSPQALERRVAEIEKMGYGIGWIEGDIGHGPAYQFNSPDGHKMEIFWEVDYFQAPEEQKTALLNRPQRRPNRGVPVRRLDHINLLAKETNENVEFLEEALGFKVRERILDDDDKDIAAWLSVTNLAHDIAIMGDALGEEARLHHICYWYGYPQHLTDVAELLVEAGHEIEVAPIKHGISQAQCMYVYEPGGNRVELFGDSGYLIFDPDWKTVEWKGEDAAQAILWHGGSNLPADFFEYGTPVRVKEPVKNS